jgi:hypothetical protein
LGSSSATRGCGKGFDKSLGVFAGDLEGMCKDLLAKGAAAGKGHRDAVRTPAGSIDRISRRPEVISEFKYSWQFLKQAITLWRLVDRDRADQIEAIKDRASLAAGDGEIRFYAPDLHELVRLLTGVEDAIMAAGIVDRHWRVPPDHLEELARRVPAMDLTTERSLMSKTNALGEVMSNAIFLRNFLSNAVNAGCVVVFG